MSVKTIITYGTFDMFHIGHLKLLQRLKELGDELIVAVSTDEFNKIKGKTPLIPFEQRFEIVENIKCVDRVIAEENWEQKMDDIQQYDIDIFAMGNDWEGKFDFLCPYCDVFISPEPKIFQLPKLKNCWTIFWLKIK
ncbi:adenylyltransferase/cytidyltransferase family protein [sulfur-oxidizing endosymbiont of Gigantopelta aegis]|uniref:adenylyltransferase/cytidyltransferase family protein n=1 Tax=sulfur-oxidizing endosymbiont of Gigantopelta aegis TaxID=2794934 RepID=UPI003CCD955B